jgi:uncharacterized membrane protein
MNTLVLSAECIVGGLIGVMRLQPFIGIVLHLGYPAYFMTILGIWYILAGLALLAPRFRCSRNGPTRASSSITLARLSLILLREIKSRWSDQAHFPEARFGPPSE